MLNLIGWIFKTTLFAIIILIAGQVVEYQGRTISDRVKTALNSIKGSTAPVSRQVSNGFKGAVKSAQEAASDLVITSRSGATSAARTGVANAEFAPADQKELHKLIQTSRAKK